MESFREINALESPGRETTTFDRRESETSLYRVYEERLLRGLDRSLLPHHIGVILDGHRRYARQTGLTDYADSYRAGMDKLVEFLGWCRDLEVPALTCWLLSRENLERPASELEPYFEVLADLFERLPDTRGGEGLRFGVIGSLDLLPDHLREAAGRLARHSGKGDRRLNIALAYGDARRSSTRSGTSSGNWRQRGGRH